MADFFNALANITFWGVVLLAMWAALAKVSARVDEVEQRLAVPGQCAPAEVP